MLPMQEAIKILLNHRYGNQLYFVETKCYQLPEILEIIDQIQRINHDVCSGFQISVQEMCKILVDLYDFEMVDTNFYDFNQNELKQVFGVIRTLTYTSMNRKKKEGILLIELTDFWELYKPRPAFGKFINTNELTEVIKTMVWNNPNAKPWLEELGKINLLS